MAALDNPLANTLAGALAAPGAFSFFQLARLLEGFFEEAPPLGGADGAGAEGAGAERVRFRALDSLAFPPVDVPAVALRPRPDGGPDLLEVTIAFLGLYGPASPLPAFHTERLLQDDLDGTLREFYDFFNHRLAALFYRCWVQYRYYLRFRPGGTDVTSRAVLALAGLRQGSAGGPVRWDRLLHHAGPLGLQSCPPSVLARVVGSYFGVAARVEEGVERRVEVPPEQRNQLGLGSCALGDDLVLGDRVPDVTGKFRLWIGPVDRPGFDAFFNDPATGGALHGLVQGVMRDALEYEVRVLPDDADLLPWQLGGAQATPLGRLSWLGSTAEASGGVGLPPVSCYMGVTTNTTSGP